MSFQAAIAGLAWPLDASADAPMFFQPLGKMLEIRAKERESGASSTTSSEEAVAAIAANVPAAIESLVLPITTIAENGDNTAAIDISDDDTVDTTDQEHYARIAVALLLVGHGYTDEAHNLVSPLSWTKETPFGYGLPTSTSYPVLAVASYAHSLVHRREAHHASEYNMTGFGNAHYWASAALRGAEVESLPLTQVRNAVLELAAAAKFAQSKAVQTWCEQKVINGGPVLVVDGWDPRLAHDLCATVMASSEEPCDPLLREFAQLVAEAELRILLGHTLRCLGYECDNLLRR